MDDFGVVSAKQLGDLTDTTHPEDDLCIETEYARPAGQNERVLTAVAAVANHPPGWNGGGAPEV
jgi:hypothetical protein